MGLDGNGSLKTYALSIEDKMAAGAFGCARNRGLRHMPCWKTKQYNLSPLGNEIYCNANIFHCPVFQHGVCHRDLLGVRLSLYYYFFALKPAVLGRKVLFCSNGRNDNLLFMFLSVIFYFYRF